MNLSTTDQLISGASSTNVSIVTESHQYESESQDCVYEDILLYSIARIVKIAGFDTAQRNALKRLIAMLVNFIEEVCRNSKIACEHTGRSVVNLSDVYIGLVTSGLDIKEFIETSKKYRSAKPLLLLDESHKIPTQQKTHIFHIGDQPSHPSHFPNFLPPLPDSHTYIHTEVSNEIDTDYIKLRHLQASNKHNMETSLVNYALLNYPSISIFQEYEKILDNSSDESIPTLILPKVLFPFDEERPYFTALVTDDVDVEEDQNYFTHILNREMEELDENEDDEVADRTIADKETIVSGI